MTSVIGELFTLMLMAFALGMDAFSIGIGMGMFQLRLKQIFFIGITVGVFHIWMPLLGMITGKFLSEQFGSIAAFAGGLLLIALGIQMFLSSFKGDDTKVMTPVGFGLILFALSVSLDSFSVGLTLGIFGARTAVAVICFGIAATLLTWTGLLIGRRVQGWLGSYSEALGGSILFAFGVKLLLPF
ncbi:putative Mn2+ efflux pump MntP [Bacillus pakistanensis]|uniref:Putative manganese efflux pump MntP n=1 Tax=Rossellomorea pakistanensis TaxID=992288 RepID=A0ABS2NBK0_9BACI|nr:manganese efflux pump MntP family protein [Bacillus pakistanensis]MBM7585247.1 putative Mn2+ efflux pump MntP [Bacillus pakistanensis]